ncbi:hypothetical protein ACFXHD_18845 [Streptomyces hydrogenans]|uniref:hypothetical protein n=1 Tax=Streptomyces hydrogenans TaxID=1873719 RepID=UPI0036B8A703
MAGLYWTGRHSEAVSRIWRTSLSAAETLNAHTEVDEVLSRPFSLNYRLVPAE